MMEHAKRYGAVMNAGIYQRRMEATRAWRYYRYGTASPIHDQNVEI
jgi:hypothetical protein